MLNNGVTNMASIKFKKNLAFKNVHKSSRLKLHIKEGDVFPIVPVEDNSVWGFKVDGILVRICKKDAGCGHNHDDEYDIIEDEVGTDGW